MKLASIALLLAFISTAHSQYDGDWYFDPSFAPDLFKEENKEFVSHAFGPYADLVTGKVALKIVKKEKGSYLISFPPNTEFDVLVTPIRGNKYRASDGMIFEFELEGESLKLRFWREDQPDSPEEFPLTKTRSESAGGGDQHPDRTRVARTQISGATP